ncbi:gamma-aminobutyric acid receptor alpha-like isoform X2 [Biomphalaria glabrata]|nr:gamma-aminobutyric acid receptor alpha-like isoform X2 [Biomphalaria glabrata]XP_055895585.1 gamma-aminobutyric acid receptor alpha-like isoform X2 [Biomphalaria glabrata]XP_055895586.1 gamma-aminobutyric acid receptor alpha-like isoform X2 [Biomphalaria glabrata]KAI8798103.1 gamma-aminobutyric acid receptor alpha isoform X2 [Biomphalaria glabrata]
MSDGKTAVNISNVLDTLLEGYDKRLRPGFGGEAVVVNADLSLRSMGPISELDMIYTLDCYFRQRWMDRRLAMNVSLENLTLGIKILERIWHPDTVFYNGQKSYLHAITSHNRFLRIGANGTVLFSQRLTIQATCRMHLENFPMDIQHCPLMFGSFAYSIEDVEYNWRYGQSKSIELAPDLRLSQFDLVGFPLTNYTRLVKGDLHSVLCVTFKLSRHAGYFLINLYLPCCLLVVLSWVSFWINREATADRIALGSLTVLTMTILGIENKSQLPKVSYITALDVYVALCFVFAIATTIEFAVVHYFTKYGTGEPLMLSSDEDSSEDEISEENTSLDSLTLQNGKFKVQDYPWPPNAVNVKVGVLAKLCHCLTRTKTKGVVPKAYKGKVSVFSNSVSQVDRASRVLFPLTFTISNVVYCIAYYLWAFSE